MVPVGDVTRRTCRGVGSFGPELSVLVRLMHALRKIRGSVCVWRGEGGEGVWGKGHLIG